MTEVTEKVDPIEVLRGLIAAGDVTQSQAAREMGVSATSLSQVLTGKYAADPTAVVEKIAAWLSAREERRRAGLPALPGWVETPTAQRVMAALSYAQLAGDIAVIYGAAGVGKTMAVMVSIRARP